jgi:RNA polymerase sigma factor (sigma-70 family)
MEAERSMEHTDSHGRLEKAYASERPRFLARLRRIGRSIEEAEDFLHDVFVETMERVHLVADIGNLPAWINSLFTRRLIDAWRHEKVRVSRGETDVAEETLREIVSGVGLDPQDGVVRDSLMDALNDALRALPAPQRRVLEAQVFGGMTFRQIADATGECIDTLTARKRYALQNLTGALRHWIDG